MAGRRVGEVGEGWVTAVTAFPNSDLVASGTCMCNGSIIVHLHSNDPRKLCVGVKCYIVHMYSMPYYTYGSTANFLVLEPTALIYIKRTVL